MVAASPNTDLHGYGEEIRKELGSRIPRDKKLKVLRCGDWAPDKCRIPGPLAQAKRNLHG